MPSFSYNGTITLSSSVKDLDASIAWFRDVLGFEEIFKVAEAGWAEVSTPADGVSIGLDQTDADVEGSGGSIPVFGVVDIDAARSELEGKGVQFAGETVELPGMVKLATFFDPDGNRYMFAQSLVEGGP
ncbi:MAG: VOC family protein [Gammaproteobacteria bacterium]|nr:VOC family protein [Gammaproteobacteria bacterium]